MRYRIIFYNCGSFIKIYTWATGFGFKPVKKYRFGFFSAPIFFLRRDWSFQNHPSWKKNLTNCAKRSFFYLWWTTIKKKGENEKERKETIEEEKEKLWSRQQKEKKEKETLKEKNEIGKKWQKEFWSSKLRITTMWPFVGSKSNPT